MKLLLKHLMIYGTVMCVLGCAKTKDNPDPFETYNRGMTKVNKAIDKVLIKPIAKTYDTIAPYPIRQGIDNVFKNLHEPTNAANHILQGKVLYAVSNVWRFLINSTIGFGGFFDIAKHMGLKHQRQDFGITLGKWGNPDSAYFVMPLIGPSTLRDTAGFIVDNGFLSVYPYIKNEPLRYGLTAARVINIRANLLETDKFIEDALDPYVAEKDAYLQNRRSQILGEEDNDLFEEVVGEDFFDEELSDDADDKSANETL